MNAIKRVYGPVRGNFANAGQSIGEITTVYAWQGRGTWIVENRNKDADVL
jgi:hypothetical protein